MPELPEVELTRQLAVDAVGRRIVGVTAPDPWWLRRGLDAPTLAATLVGTTITGVGRHGKLLLVEVDGGEATLGLHFGMTGRLQLDGRWALDELEYGSSRDEPAWDRLTLDLRTPGRRGAAGGGSGRRSVLRVTDPRRLGGAELDPDLSRLGPDALTLSAAQLRGALARAATPVKARLLDQAKVAGVGNLLADETLWRAGIDPARPAASIVGTEATTLAGHVRRTIRLLLSRGGSHTGDLQPERRPGGRCPRDGAELRRRTIGGRTTWSCPEHQV